MVSGLDRSDQSDLYLKILTSSSDLDGHLIYTKIGKADLEF